MFLENTIFQHKHSLHRQTAIVSYVFLLLDPVQTRKCARRAWSRTVCSRLLRQLPRSNRPPVSRENAGVHSVSYSSTSHSTPGSSHATFPAIAAKPISMSIFAYLFYSTWGIVPLVAYCALLVGINSNAPSFPAAGSAMWASRFTSVAFGVAHQLDFVSVSVTVFKHCTIGKQQNVSRAAEAPPAQQALASHALCATICAMLCIA